MATTTFYIFHGEDDLSIDEAVEKLRKGMGENGDLNTSEFDGSSASVPEILNAVTSYPFLSDKRLIIVKGLIAWITRKGAGDAGKRGVEQLLEEVPKLPEYSRLVLVERSTISESNKIIQLGEKIENGYVKAYSVPKDMTQWIIKRAKGEYDVEIDPRAVVALAEVTSNDLRRADNELAKLAAFIHPEKRITEEHVAALTPYVAEARTFDMVDALALGQSQRAMQLLHRLLDDTKENDPFSVYGMIVRQFRLLLLAKEHLTTGGNPGSIAGAIGVHPFVAQKLAQQTRAFTLPQLEKIYRALLDNDIRMKTGRIKPEIALDLLVANLTG